MFAETIYIEEVRLRFVLVTCGLLLFMGRGAKLTIGPVSEEFTSENRCTLQLPHEFAKKEGQYIFMTDREKGAVVNVDGVDVPLNLVKSQGDEAREKVHIGDRSTYWYAGAGLDVRVDYVVTGLCPGRKEACDVTYYEAVMTVRREKVSRTVAAKAACER